MTRKIIILALLAALPGPLFADTLYLINGETLKGRITSETEASVAIELKSGPREIPRDEIRRVVKDKPAASGKSSSPTTAARPAPAAPRAASPRDKARALVLSGLYPDAVAAYNPLARGSKDGGLAAEYAFALALAGHRDLALSHLDRAFLADASNPEVMFFGSAVFEALGMNAMAGELRRPPPGWLSAGVPKIQALERPRGEYKELLATANLFIAQRRFASAAAQFDALVRAYPDAQLPWAGYAIALEKLGAFKAAAAAVDKDLKLGKQDSPETVNLLNRHKAELEARPPVTYAPAPKLNEMLKGRYLAFLGLSYSHTETDGILMLQSRVGKFLTNRFDAGASLGLTTGYDNSDFNGLSFGVSGRYNKPLPVSMPLNLTAGARFEYQPGPEDNFAMLLSPGLSYVLDNGALDLYLDFALTGPLKGTQTLSLGYTVYFGGARK